MNIKSSVAVACFLPGRAKDLSAPLYLNTHIKGNFLMNRETFLVCARKRCVQAKSTMTPSIGSAPTTYDVADSGHLVA